MTDSISTATARIRSRKFPESSRCCRKSSNCFSIFWVIGEEGTPVSTSAPGVIVREEMESKDEQRIEASRTTAVFLQLLKLRMRWELTGINGRGKRWGGLGLGFKERESENPLKITIREHDFMFCTKRGFLICQIYFFSPLFYYN